MRILVTGAQGQLGSDIVSELEKRKIEYIATDINILDIIDKNAVDNFFDTNGPTHVIHCAAYTAVDKAEEDENICRKVNVDGTANLVEACRRLNLPMMYFSTDYIFGGEGDKPYKIDSIANPLGVYAKTKYEGELKVVTLDKFFIVRISWVFGKNGNNFINTMIRLSEERDELKVVDDQIGSPTYTKDLSVLVCDMIQTDKYGIYHASNEGYVSWYDFAKEIFRLTGKTTKVIPVSTEEYNAKAHRPKNSRLDKSKLLEMGFNLLPTWQDALKMYLQEKKWIK